MLVGVASQVSASVLVSLTAPYPHPISTFVPGANITLTATASVSNSGYSISKVEFFHGPTLIGTDTDSPYGITWNSVPQGNYTLTAKATATKIGSPDLTGTAFFAVPIVVTATPIVSITSPISGNMNGKTLTVSVAASDSDGTIASVTLNYRDRQTQLDPGGSITITQAPYDFAVTLNPAEYGIEYIPYLFDAIATDNQGRTSSTARVTMWVGPSIALTGPANGATYTAPAAITLNASYSVSNANLSKIEFFDGSTLIGQILTPTAPYTFSWQNVPVGTYSLTAKATATGGWTRTSAPINVTVTSGVQQIHFIHVDHLNTPRKIYDASAQLRWRWDQVEPFGVNVPDENPSGLGIFDLPLRLPGQYFDKETNLHYNYYRDFDPSLGIYKQSDLIGLRGGLNTYAYAASPLMQIDPLGLMGFGGGGAAGGTSKGIPKSTSGKAAEVNVFGCIVGCLRSPINGSSEPQASLEPTVGGGIEICENPAERKSCPMPKPVGGCGMYDPNCDNTWQYPGVPAPRNIGGFLIGVSIKRDGRVCFQYGLFGSAPLPSYDLGGIYER